MHKLLAMMFLLVFTVVACNKSDGDPDSVSTTDDTTTTPSLPDETDPDPTPGPGPAPVPGDNTTSVPTEALTFDVNIKFVNFTSTQEAKMMKAVELIKRLMASEEFRTRVLNHKYNSVKTYVDNKGLSNSQIYQSMLTGKETLSSSANNAMDVEVELYYQNSTTVGYTYANSKRIWVNTKYFNTYSIASVAANLTHEWLHKLGYGHASSYSVSRDYSVPYGIGGIVRSLGPSFY